VLPAELRDRLSAIQMYAPGFQMPLEDRERLDQLHEAILGIRRVAFAYTREDGAQTRRTVRPLGLFFWSGVWTLVGWCELRDGFRTFRLDRMADLTIGVTPYSPRPNQSLANYLATVLPGKSER
jgi:predicted DNA-binding transcriptional regulator YafY